MWKLLPYLLTGDPDATKVDFVIGRPVDLSILPEDVGAEIPEPSIVDTVARCDPCGVGIWLGPNQMRMTGPGVVRLCLLCAAIVRQLTGERAEVHAIDPRAEHLPRRTTR